MALPTSGISFTGLSSGIDSQSIISSLMTLRRRPIDAMQSHVSELSTETSAFNALKSKLTALQDQTKSLDDLSDVAFGARSIGEEFRKLKATSSNEAVLTAKVDPQKAVAGTHTLRVQNLASASVDTGLNGNGTTFSSLTSAIDTGNLIITSGGESTTITIDSSHNTLQGVRDAINQSSAPVAATTVYDGTGYSLVLYGKGVGEENAVTVDASDLQQGDPSIQLHISETQAAANASLTLDGITISSPDNTLEDALYGITLDLHSAAPATDIFLTVENDTSAVRSAIDSFVSAYNSTVGALNDQMRYSGDQKAKVPALFGNATVRSLAMDLSEAVSQPVEGLTGPYTMLADIGVHLDRNGLLQVDDDKLTTALGEDLEGVRGLFVSEGGSEGVAARLTRKAKDYLDTKDGRITVALKGIVEQTRSLDDQITQAEAGLDSYQETITKQFLAMEQAISQFNSQKQALSAYFPGA